MLKFSSIPETVRLELNISSAYDINETSIHRRTQVVLHLSCPRIIVLLKAVGEVIAPCRAPFLTGTTGLFLFYDPDADARA